MFFGGSGFPTDPVQPITTLKTAWNNVRKKAAVMGRWHDNRHTLITELAENGAGDETIMEIAGHVSRQMLSRYAHIRTEAKRKALEDVEKKRAAARKCIKERFQGKLLPPGNATLQTRLIDGDLSRGPWERRNAGPPLFTGAAWLPLQRTCRYSNYYEV